jgi:thiol-disulfide isomerase/thioredoxin
MASMKEFRYLSDVELNTTIISNELLTLVLVVKEGVSLCYLMESNLKKLSDKIRNKISIFKIDYKINRDSVISYGIQNTPTLLLLKRGILIEKIEGLTSKKELISRIQHNL